MMVTSLTFHVLEHEHSNIYLKSILQPHLLNYHVVQTSKKMITENHESPRPPGLDPLIGKKWMPREQIATLSFYITNLWLS